MWNSKIYKSLRKKAPFFLGFFLSFFLVAWGQTARIAFFAFLTSFCGYALFWRSMFFFSDWKKCFLASFVWFALVQSIQLSWMTSTEYQGYYIFLVYLLLLMGLGIQFAFLSVFVAKNRDLSFKAMLAISSLWVLMEWSRLWLLSGFTWNPSGLALTFHFLPMQMASIGGVYALSFWVMFVNLAALRVMVAKKRKGVYVHFVILAFLPYLFGLYHQAVWKSHFSLKKEPLEILLVQTCLLPEERDVYLNRVKDFISPPYQWQRILTFLQNEKKAKVDLIVLPESALPFGAHRTFYPLEKVREIWEEVYGEEALAVLPEPKEPLASFNVKKNGWEVSNSYWAQAISNFYDAELIIGLDDRDVLMKRNYNAAFYFQPFGFLPKRYEKRVLVPIAEYFPFSWCAKMAEKIFGINDQFTSGKRAKIFSGANHYGISICYEETYAHLIRESRLLGAECFVNITNDVWFPSSKLPLQHFEHGRLRAVENGVPLIRACNTGVTGGVDCFGRTVGFFEKEKGSMERSAGAFFLSLPTHSYPTLYTLLGDYLILAISLFFLCLYFLKKPKFFFKQASGLFRKRFRSKLRLPKKE
jgi:apolipoprotein N-acyltransferase